jgi:hypothetical protein
VALDASGPPRGAEFVVFTGASSEPPSEPPPERSRQPIPVPEPEPEPLVPLPAADAGKPGRDGGGEAGVVDAGAKPTPRDASRD